MINSKIFCILIAEDDVINQQIYREQLIEHFEIKIVNNGEACLSELKQENSDFHPNLVLLDVDLPKLNGYQVCKILRHDLNFKHLPIIMVSAFASLKEQQKGLEVGANDFLTKPYEEEQLFSLINKYLPHTGS